ncbi:unnamed protein product [Closterium sp. NIES-64]|nr:unnamed protein product [Closterium sp. NIES-64]
MLDTSPFPSLPPLPPLPHLLSLLFLLFLLFLFFLLFSPLLSSALPPIPFLLTACPPVLKGPMSRGMLHVLAQAGTAAQRREECPMCWRKLALQDETWYVQDETWYVQDETWYVQDETWHGQDETWYVLGAAAGVLQGEKERKSGAAAGVLQGEKERKVQPTTSTPPLIANLSSLLSFFLTLMRCSQELLLACYREKEIQAAEQRAAAAAAAAAIAASVRGAAGRGTAARGVAARGVAVRGHVRRGAQPMGTGGSSPWVQDGRPPSLLPCAIASRNCRGRTGGLRSQYESTLQYESAHVYRTVVLHPCSLPPSPAAAAAAAAAGAEGAAAGQQSGMFVFESTQEQRQGSSQALPLGTGERVWRRERAKNGRPSSIPAPSRHVLLISLHSLYPKPQSHRARLSIACCPLTSGSPVDRSLPSSLLSSLRLTPIFILFVPTRLNPLRATVTSGSPVERWLPSSLCHATSSLSVPVQTTLLTLLPLDSPSSPLQATVTSGSPVDRWLPSSLLSSLRHATSSSSSSRGISGSSPRSFALSFSPHRHRSSRSASPSSSTIPATNTTTTTTITTSSSSSSSSSASLSAALASSSSPSASASAPSASLPTTATSLAATATLSDTTSAAVAAGTPANSASSAAAATSDAGAAPACPFTSPPIACYRADPSVLAAEAACSPPTFSLSPLRPRPPSALSFYPPETSSSGETNRGFSLSAGALPLDTPLGATSAAAPGAAGQGNNLADAAPSSNSPMEDRTPPFPRGCQPHAILSSLKARLTLRYVSFSLSSHVNSFRLPHLCASTCLLAPRHTLLPQILSHLSVLLFPSTPFLSFFPSPFPLGHPLLSSLKSRLTSQCASFSPLPLPTVFFFPISLPSTSLSHTILSFLHSCTASWYLYILPTPSLFAPPSPFPSYPRISQEVPRVRSSSSPSSFASQCVSKHTGGPKGYSSSSQAPATLRHRS